MGSLTKFLWYAPVALACMEEHEKSVKRNGRNFSFHNMETRSSSIGESGGTGGYAEDDSLEELGSNIAPGNSGTSACDACPNCMDVCSFKSTSQHIVAFTTLHRVPEM